VIFHAISAHGFGHAARSCQIAGLLPPEVPLTVSTDVPKWFVREWLGSRCFELVPGGFDRGTLGPDATLIDLDRTIATVEQLQVENGSRLDALVAFLERSGARLVVSDIPSLPLRAARVLGIPSILVANFTWPGAYRHLLEMTRPGAELAARARMVIDALQAEYELADLILAPGFCVEADLPRRREVPLVAGPGVARREELAAALDLDPARPIYLLYLGREGMQGVDWGQLGQLPPAQLIDYHPSPDAGAGVARLPPDLMPNRDVIASVDVVIGKAGYNTCAGCVASGVRMLYPPRPRFAEWYAIDAAMKRWGGALCVPDEDFKSLNWRPWLERLGQQSIDGEALPFDGGRACARVIEQTWRSGRIPDHF